jgi:O-antigen/teichoic acid export membrane protein
MSNQKLSADTLQEELNRLRDASRTRAKRVQLTARLMVFLCLLFFLALSLVAAKALWDSLQAPVHIAVLLAVLAACIQQVLGLAMHRGHFRRRQPRRQPLWWALMLLSGTALVLLAG